MLYNPNRLSNVTDTGSTGSVPHDSLHNLNSVPHLRRSLPLCNRGTNLMPLESLIDGPSQTDKCGRPTPSGAAYAVFSDAGHIAASAARFMLNGSQGKTIDVFNIHPTSGLEAADTPGIQALVNMRTAPPYAGFSWVYPPIAAGDFNSQTVDGLLPNFTKVFETDRDVIRIGMGDPQKFPSQFTARPVQTLVLPDGEGQPYLVSDHIGLFARFDLSGPNAGALRSVFIDGPAKVKQGERYQLQAFASGDGTGYSYIWNPGNINGRVLNSVAGAGNSTVSWEVTATDQLGNTRKANHGVSVMAPPPPPPQQCRSNCEDERDACMTDVGTPGGPLASQCASAFQACIRGCR
jgi:hypothetical protein